MVPLLYADDVLCASAHHNLVCLSRAANILESTSARQLRCAGLWSAYFAMGPNFGNDALSRRKSAGTGGAGPQRTGAQPQRTGEGQSEIRLTEWSLREEPEKLRYPEVQEMRVLGAMFDDGFGSQKQFVKICTKVRVRMAIMERLAGCWWELETTMMRITGEALAVSLFRYVLTTAGSGLDDKYMRRIDTCILNVLARMTTGVARSARIPALHAFAGILSMRNLYIQQCASMLDLVLRASNATIESRIRQWLMRMYGVKTWEATAVSFVVGDQAGSRVGELRFLDFDD